MSDHIKNKYHNLIEDIIHDFEVAYCVTGKKVTGDSSEENYTDKYLEDLKKKFAEINNYKIKQVKNVE